MAKTIVLIVALVVGLVSTPLHARRGELLHEMNDRRYTEVRAKLRALGYVPVSVRERDPPDGICPGFASCRAYPELVTCSGTGIALCQSAFRHKRTRRYIKVWSYGETDKKVDGIEYVAAEELRYWGIRRPN
ncbi:MAG: hypothetical protein ACTHLU_00490 [Novosphingobium sp.]